MARKSSKSAFILKLPANMPAMDAVAKAAAAGIKVSAAYVYNIRAAHRAKSAKAKRGLGRPRKATVGRRAGRTSSGRASNGSNLEARLRGAIAELGLARAREVFDEVAAAFGA